MSEKNNSQLGETAKRFYSEHEQRERWAGLARKEINHRIEAAQHAENGRLYHERRDEYQAGIFKRERDRYLESLGRLVLGEGMAKEASERNLSEAAEHFEQNAGDYHDLAVTEAAADGVEIKVQQQNSPAEQIEVHKA